MHRIFQKFIDLLSCGQDAGAFAEAIAITAKVLDLSCFAYLALPPPGGATPLILSTYPADWVAHYLRKHYERLDPVITRALNNPEPFRWGLSLSPSALSPTQQHFFDEAAEFGIRAGFTVPIHDGHGPIAALTFAANEKRAHFEKCIDSYGRVLQLIALY